MLVARPRAQHLVDEWSICQGTNMYFDPGVPNRFGACMN